MNIIEKFYYNIGNYGNLIVFGISVFILRKKQVFLTVYIFGIILNEVINYFLKGIIRQPRPSEDESTLNILHTAHKVVGSHKYGMPSGHSQCVFFSTAFIYLVTRNTKLALFYIFMSLLTVIQRVNYYYHTVAQVVLGGLLGLAVGTFFYFYAIKNITGKLTLKPDDDGPI